jgi:GrpB-like predicted nucleotidyltransferase (UPF0157 family)
VIDICGSVPSIEELGYACRGEFGIPGRRYAVLCSPDGKIGYIHLHCYPEGHPEIRRHLLFRNYLRENPSALEIYAREKRRLTVGRPIDRAAYTEEKLSCIQALLKEAEAFPHLALT